MLAACKPQPTSSQASSAFHPMPNIQINQKRELEPIRSRSRKLRMSDFGALGLSHKLKLWLCPRFASAGRNAGPMVCATIRLGAGLRNLVNFTSIRDSGLVVPNILSLSKLQELANHCYFIHSLLFLGVALQAHRCRQILAFLALLILHCQQRLMHFNTRNNQ
jgi:hypothetical protein